MADSEPPPFSETDGYGWPTRDGKVGASIKETQLLAESFDRIELADLRLTAIATGQEHSVFTSDREDLTDVVVKITRPGGYGIIMDGTDGSDKISWRRGSAREYLQRIVRQNKVFADSVEILGWAPQRHETGASWPCIVSTQRFRAGTPPSTSEIHAYMHDLGFERVPPDAVSLAYLREHVFYAPAHNILVSDCRSANFVKAAEGLAVIDVIVQRPAKALRHLLRQLLGLRLDAERVFRDLEDLSRGIPIGRKRTMRIAQFIDDLGGEGPALTALRIAGVSYARGESGHGLRERIQAHAEASAGSRRGAD